MAADQPIFSKLKHRDVLEIIDADGKSFYYRYQQLHRGEFRLRREKDFQGEPNKTIDLRTGV